MKMFDTNIHIDRDLCFACGICVQRCIMDNLRLSLAPCRQACPLDLNCQGYIRLIAQGKETEAAQELRKYTPYAGILGRICSRPCEDVCERERSIGDGAVNIRAIKRYLDAAYPHITRSHPDIPYETGLKAAVIGSGPAGLMAAYELRVLGHEVTVFEARHQAGGLLRHGIPAFRLPQSEVDAAIQFLRDMDISFRLGCTVGEDVPWAEIDATYGAILLAIGADRSVPLPVPGGQAAGVISVLELLSRARQGRLPDLSGKSVLVIGGGNTASDAAVTCRHCGAKEVRMICLENPREMPAFAAELSEAREMGVIFENCWGLNRIEAGPEGTLLLVLKRCLSVYDKQGRFAPQFDENGMMHRLEGDLVVVAIGQRRVDPKGLPPSLLDQETGGFCHDRSTLQSLNAPKVFVCGDCAKGSSSVVQAFADGKRAAQSASRLLLGEHLRYEQDLYQALGMVDEYQVRPERTTGDARQEPKRLAVKERGLNTETELCQNRDEARKEAERCLSCGRAFECNETCWYCLPCEIECPSQALYVKMPYQVR